METVFATFGIYIIFVFLCEIMFADVKSESIHRFIFHPFYAFNIVVGSLGVCAFIMWSVFHYLTLLAGWAN